MTTTIAAGSRNRGRTVLTWILTVLLAVGMLGAGVTKLIGDPAQVQLFTDIGIGQWFRYLTGALEVAGVIGLFIPRLRALAALGLLLVLIGATITNLVIVPANTLFSVLLGALALAVFLLRRHELAELRRAA